jgi:DNA-binding protein H-NS
MSESDSAKQAAVAWIHAQMDRYALTFEDLVAAGCFAAAPVSASEPAAQPVPAEPAVPAAPVVPAAPKPSGAVYRNAMGQSWDGTGPYPDWLQRAVNAGQSIEFFRVG